MTGASRPRATVREVPRDSAGGFGGTGVPPASPRGRPVRERPEARRRAAPLDRPGAFEAAGRGVRHAWATQVNLRVHAAIGLVAAGTGLAVGLSPVEFAMIALAATIVVVAEVLNTAIEAAVDVASPTHHPVAAIAKDVAAGAVLLAAGGSVVVGILVFGPHLLRMVDR